MAAAMTVLLEHDFDSYERNSFFNVREVVPYFLIFLLSSVLVYHNMYNKFFTFKKKKGVIPKTFFVESLSFGEASLKPW